MKTIQIYLAFCLWIGTLTVSVSQPKETEISEDDLSSSILLKHYMNAPNLTPKKWTQFTENEVVYLKAYCELEDKARVFIYDKSGVMKEEWEIIENVPKKVEDYLDFEFAKYKVLSYQRVENKVLDKVYYSVDINSRYRGFLNVRFDVSGEPMVDGISPSVVSN